MGMIRTAIVALAVLCASDDTPTPFATVTLYVDPVTGSNGNTGLSPAFPLADMTGAATRIGQMQAHVGQNPARVIVTPW